MSGRKLEALLLWALIAGLVLAAVGLIVDYSRQRNPEVVASAATDNDGCLTCHGDPYYRPKTSDRPWQELYTDQATLAASTHRSLTCTSCHQTFDTGQPMDAASAQSLCGRCHEQQQKLQEASVHSDIKVTSCLTCHSKEQSGHDILPIVIRSSLHAIPIRSLLLHRKSKMSLEVLSPIPVHSYQGNPSGAESLMNHVRIMMKSKLG